MKDSPLRNVTLSLWSRANSQTELLLVSHKSFTGQSEGLHNLVVVKWSVRAGHANGTELFARNVTYNK